MHLFISDLMLALAHLGSFTLVWACVGWDCTCLCSCRFGSGRGQSEFWQENTYSQSFQFTIFRVEEGAHCELICSEQKMRGTILMCHEEWKQSRSGLFLMKVFCSKLQNCRHLIKWLLMGSELGKSCGQFLTPECSHGYKICSIHHLCNILEIFENNHIFDM